MTPLVGGHLADAYFGRYKTIMGASLIYILGSVVLTLSAAWKMADLCFVALALFAIATGGIKPCVSPFGADQIILQKTASSSTQSKSLSGTQGVLTATTSSPSGPSLSGLAEDGGAENMSASSDRLSVLSSPLPGGGTLALSAADIRLSSMEDGLETASLVSVPTFHHGALSPSASTGALSGVVRSRSTVRGAAATSIAATTTTTIKITDAEDAAEKKRQTMLQTYFYTFYFVINLGSVFSLLTVPILRTQVSYVAAFAVPAILNLIGVIIFWLGRKTYLHIPPGRSAFAVVFRVMRAAWRRRGRRPRLDRATVLPPSPPPTSPIGAADAAAAAAAAAQEGSQPSHGFVPPVISSLGEDTPASATTGFGTKVACPCCGPNCNCAQARRERADPRSRLLAETAATLYTNPAVAPMGPGAPIEVDVDVDADADADANSYSAHNDKEDEDVADWDGDDEDDDEEGGGDNVDGDADDEERAKNSSVVSSDSADHARKFLGNAEDGRKKDQEDQQHPLSARAAGAAGVRQKRRARACRTCRACKCATSGPGKRCQCTAEDEVMDTSMDGRITWIDNAYPVRSKRDIADTKRVLALLPVFSTLPFFWCLMNQQGSTWVLQAKEMDRRLGAIDYVLDPEHLQVLNPIFVFILLPTFEYLFRRARMAAEELEASEEHERQQQQRQVDQEHNPGGDGDLISVPSGFFNDPALLTASAASASASPGSSGATAGQRGVGGGEFMEQGEGFSTPRRFLSSRASPYASVASSDDAFSVASRPPCKKRCLASVNLSPLGRLGAGMLVAAASYMYTAFVDYQVQRSNPGTVSILWQVPQYFFITIAEVLVSVTSNQFAFDQAPAHMKSLVTALLMLSSALGDLITGVIYSAFLWLPRYGLFIVFAGLVVLNFCYLAFVKRYYIYVKPPVPARVAAVTAAQES